MYIPFAREIVKPTSKMGCCDILQVSIVVDKEVIKRAKSL